MTYRSPVVEPTGTQAEEAARPAGGRRLGGEELAERRRREIIEAAYEVFVERGYTAAGIADIAQKLGIGHGTFYRYFKNKRDILDHVFDYGVERILSSLIEDVPPEAESLDQFREQMHTIGERLFERLDAEPGLVQVVALEATSIDEELTLRALGLIDTVTAVTRAYLDNGVRRGFLRADLDSEVTAKAINGMILPGLLDSVRGKVPPSERERYIQAAIELILRGIAAPA